MEIKPSFYNGITFRSRTEARWAAFFDCLNLKYDYEPCYFAEAWGTYTPDFYIFRDDDLEIGPFWIEVKGQPPSTLERFKLRDICNRLQCEGLLLVNWPEESGELYYYNPWRDGQDYTLRQSWLDLLLGADRACFAQARAVFIDDAQVPLESPLLTVTEVYDSAKRPGAPPVTLDALRQLVMWPAPPTGKELVTNWRAQRRAILTLWRGNKKLSKQAAGLAKDLAAVRHAAALEAAKLTQEAVNLRHEIRQWRRGNNALQLAVALLIGALLLCAYALYTH